MGTLGLESWEAGKLPATSVLKGLSAVAKSRVVCSILIRVFCFARGW